MRRIDCKAVGALLGRFHDGELDAGEASPVEEHVRQCERCARELGDLRRLDSMLDFGLPEPELQARVASTIADRSSPGWWLTAAAAILPLALGAIAGSLLFNGQAGAEPVVSTTAGLIEESFGPGSLRGIDDLARDLDQAEEGDR